MAAVSRGLISIFAVCAALAIAGCGDSSDSSSSTASEGEPAPAKSADSTSTATKPKVEVPSGPPPKKLESKELVEGTGAAAKAGDEVLVQYVGVDYKTGKQFDASWDRNEPFGFTLGGGEVIAGWDQGVVGMKVGGRRELIIPPNLAYGPAGAPPAIAPNATLVFVIDLLAVK
jgi:peptidylprolyl isomerase